MLQFIVRRVLFIAVVCVCIIFFVHLGMRMARNSDLARSGGDVFAVSRQAWQETQAFIGALFRSDWGGVRLASGYVPMQQVLRTAYVNSMGLLLVALLSASLIGILLGTVTALVKRQTLVLPLLMLTVIGISTPSFFAGLLFQVMEIKFLALTGRRLVSIAGFGWDIQHMLMPVLVLAARPLAYITRASFIALDRVMKEDYIRTAFSKGLSLERTVVEHAFRNLAVPVLTAIGVSLRFSLSTLPVVELFFSWPGLGRALLEAIDARQSTVVAVFATALGLTLLIVNLALDLLYRILDPRMRTDYEAAV